MCDLDQGRVVGVPGTVDGRVINLAASIRVRQGFQDRLYARQAQADQPAVLVGRLGVLRQKVLRVLVEPFELGLVGQQDSRVFRLLLEHAAEGGRQLCQSFVNLLQFGAAVGVQLRAAADELPTPILQQRLRLRPFLDIRGLFNLLNALPQLFVQEELRKVLRQFRGHRRLNIADFLGSHGAGVVEDNREHAVEHLP